MWFEELSFAELGATYDCSIFEHDGGTNQLDLFVLQLGGDNVSGRQCIKGDIKNSFPSVIPGSSSDSAWNENIVDH